MLCLQTNERKVWEYVDIHEILGSRLGDRFPDAAVPRLPPPDPSHRCPARSAELVSAKSAAAAADASLGWRRSKRRPELLDRPVLVVARRCRRGRRVG